MMIMMNHKVKTINQALEIMNDILQRLGLKATSYFIWVDMVDKCFYGISFSALIGY